MWAPDLVWNLVRLEYAEKYINEDSTFFDDVTWSGRTEINFFGINDAIHVLWVDGSAHHVLLISIAAEEAENIRNLRHFLFLCDFKISTNMRNKALTKIKLILKLLTKFLII